MKREIKKHLFDINTSIDSIFEFIGEKGDFKEYIPLLKKEIEHLLAQE